MLIKPGVLPLIMKEAAFNELLIIWLVQYGFPNNTYFDFMPSPHTKYNAGEQSKGGDF